MKQSKTEVKVVFNNLDLLDLIDLKELKRMIMKSYGMDCIDVKEMESSYWNVDKVIGSRIFSNWKESMDMKREYSTEKELAEGEEFERFKAMEGMNGSEFKG